MVPDVHPILLCGGSGTRLWPVSRKSFPKQFTKIIGDESLFQQAVKRLAGPGFEPPVVVTGDDFRFIVTEQLAGCQIAPRGILIEPDARNTAPAILSAALYLEGLEPGALMLVAPTDHVISDADAFRSAVQVAIPRALAGDIVTFGITPDRPETAYGYIELDLSVKAATDEPQKIVRFIEKPDAKRAAQLLASSNVLWNSGVFLFTTETIIGAGQRHCPELIAQVADAVSGAHVDLGFTRLSEDAWSKVTDISIDYAIMEPGDNIVAMPYASGWSDLGSWDAVERWMLRRFDRVSTISSAMLAKLNEKGVPSDRVRELRNWADLDLVSPGPVDAEMRAKLGIETAHVALYSDNIANKQGLEILPAAARLLSHRDDITLLICSDGPMLGTLREACKDLPRVKFTPLQPRERLGALLRSADIHLLPQIAGAADLVLPSKLKNMLASGRPIIATANPGTALADEIGDAGIVTLPGDASALALAICELIDDPARRLAMGQRGGELARTRWSPDAILAELEGQLNDLVAFGTSHPRNAAIMREVK